MTHDYDLEKLFAFRPVPSQGQTRFIWNFVFRYGGVAAAIRRIIYSQRPAQKSSPATHAAK
jgi:hypothetical protein